MSIGPVRTEEILDPELPMVDAHHHLMDKPGMRYLFDDLLHDIRSGHRITATVYIESRAMLRASGPEALRPVGETEFANGVAAMSASGAYGDVRACAAIIGYADLTLGAAVEEVLDAHAAAGGGRFRGIRQGSYWDAAPETLRYVTMTPPPELLRDSRFREGFGVLARQGLSFDAVMFHPQLPELVELAGAFPDTQIVLNHMGFALGIGPYAGRRDEIFAAWKASLAEVAKCENVLVKTGGCGIPVWGFDFEQRTTKPSSVELAQAWRPYVETAIELFGPERCMMESNFPADSPSCEFVELWNALKRITAGASATERESLFSGTATRAYQLDLA